MKSYTQWFLLIVLSALLVMSCKKDDNPVTTNPPPAHATGSYVGMVTGASESGVLTLTVASAAASPKTKHVFVVLNLTGTLTVNGVSIPVSGTYDTGTDSVHATAGTSPNIYTFVGTYSGGVFIGSYTGPNGPGGFSTQSSSGPDTVKVYLGHSISLVQGHSGARLNMVVKGNSLLGLAVGIDGNKTPFSGTISGDSIKINVTVGILSAEIGRGKFNALHTTADGVYDVSQFDPENPDHGTWSVDLAP